MGAVYLGRHIKLGRSAAVKFLHAELTGNKEVVARFYREAQAASSISHANIIDVFDVGVSEWGEPYLVMEYLSGENLGSLLDRKGTVSLAAACGIMEPALRALSAAHEHGIVHRDLKPENIFLARQDDAAPVVKLIDFGISKFVQNEQTKLTRTGALLGTPSYMSPEQARGKGEFDHRTDIYSMGVILYSMLTGELPFVGESYNDLIYTILTEAPREPSEVCDTFPMSAEPIVKRLLEKDPDKRYGTCPELIEALEELAEYDSRTEALAELARDMPKDCVATGDLGVEVRPVDEVAATVFASMGPNPVETVPDVARKPSPPPPASLHEPYETGDLVTVPPPSRTRRRERSLVPIVVLFLLLVGGGGYLYSKGMLPGVSDAPLKEDKHISSLSLSGNSAKREGERADDNSSHGGVETSPVGDTVGIAASDEGSRGGSTADRKPGAETDKSATGGSGSPDTATVSEENDLASTPGNAPGTPDAPPVPPLDTSAAPSLASGTKELPNEPAAPDRLPDKGAPSEPSESLSSPNPLPPLAPVTVNGLLEDQMGRVKRCYELARATSPGLEGVLRLLVSVEGSRVNATILQNELTPALANCVLRAVRNIRPPPNDGRLVEIEKEYSFVGTN